MTPCRRSAVPRPPLALAAALLVPALAVAPARAAGLPPAIRAEVDATVAKVLAETGAPGASIAIVRDGAIAYLGAYGRARLSPPVPAGTAMRYEIGSVSKQFTAALLVRLAQEGRLSLDDPVARFFPEVTRAREITVRQLLSHTSGLRDFFPQDYVPAPMLEPTTPRAVMDRWARQPLDFEPGTRYQYSNTGFVVAAAIAERVGGRPLFEQLRERFFAPLGMTSAVDVDQGRLGPDDPAGYLQVALGPLRPAPREGRGWMSGAGELAMTAEDLARWDVALITGAVLDSSATRALATEVLLANGAGTRYGLGIGVRLESDRRILSHDGEMSGFTAENRVYPDDGAAIVVLVNQDASRAAAAAADGIARVLFVSASPADSAKLAQVRDVFLALQRGTIDRALLTPDADRYFDAAALADCRASLGPLGPPGEFELTRQGLRGGYVTRVYRVETATKSLEIVTRSLPDGRFEQYLVHVAG